MIFLILLAIISQVTSVTWRCSQGCDEPLNENDVYSCVVAGNKDANTIVTEDFYSMFPSEDRNVSFICNFRYYDPSSNHYHSYGCRFGRLSGSTYDFYSSWNSPYKNQILTTYVKTFIHDDEIYMQTIYYSPSNTLLSDVTRLVNVEDYPYLSHSQFLADVGDSYSNSARIYIHDFSTNAVVAPMKFIRNIDLDDTFFDNIYNNGATKVNNELYISSDTFPRGTDVAFGEIEGDLVKLSISCDQHSDVYWNIYFRYYYPTYHNGFNYGCYLVQYMGIDKNNDNIIYIGTHSYRDKLECYIKNFELYEFNTMSPIKTSYNKYEQYCIDHFVAFSFNGKNETYIAGANPLEIIHTDRTDCNSFPQGWQQLFTFDNSFETALVTIESNGVGLRCIETFTITYGQPFEEIFTDCGSTLSGAQFPYINITIKLDFSDPIMVPTPMLSLAPTYDPTIKPTSLTPTYVPTIGPASLAPTYDPTIKPTSDISTLAPTIDTNSNSSDDNNDSFYITIIIVLASILVVLILMICVYTIIKCHNCYIRMTANEANSIENNLTSVVATPSAPPKTAALI